MPGFRENMFHVFKKKASVSVNLEKYKASCKATSFGPTPNFLYPNVSWEVLLPHIQVHGDVTHGRFLIGLNFKPIVPAASFL